jgi:hypothetical protein
MPTRINGDRIPILLWANFTELEAEVAASKLLHNRTLPATERRQPRRRRRHRHRRRRRWSR